MAEEITDKSEFDEITTRDQAKLASSATKGGYKDGIFDGQNSVYQAGFDTGYAEGFKNAFSIGKQQGLLIGYDQIQNNTTNYQEDLLLKKPSRGHCQICTNEALLNKTIPEVVQIQSNHAEKVQQAIQLKYKDTNNSIDNFLVFN